MTKTIFTIKWNTHGNETEQLINKAIEHLDGRKKHLRDDTKNRRIVTSILAQRMGEFTVVLGNIDKEDVDALKGVLECLTGPVLTLGKGRSTYALREAYMAPAAQFITDSTDDQTKRPTPSITTKFGNIYRDGSHSEVPFDDIRLFGYSKPSLVRIVAPHQHWHMFVDDEPTPSANWKDMIETVKPHDRHNELMDLIAAQGNMRGVAVVRYGEDAFLAISADSALFTIDTTLIRFSGKSGQLPLLNITDIYQRQHIRWGSKAQRAVAA